MGFGSLGQSRIVQGRGSKAGLLNARLVIRSWRWEKQVSEGTCLTKAAAETPSAQQQQVQRLEPLSPGELAVQSVSDPGRGSLCLVLLCFMSCRFQTWISALAESLQVTYYPTINSLVLLTLEWVCPPPPITNGYTVSSG